MANREPAGWYQAMVGRLASRWEVLGPDSSRPCLKFLPLRSIDRTFDDRLLVVGDAAGIVKPTTGGGIYYGILSAGMAAEVGGAALTNDRLDRASLSAYQVRWRRRLAGEFQAQWALRHIAERLSDRQIDSLFELALVDGVMPIVHRTASFNSHRRMIQALLRHPPARRIFWPVRS
jgi:digeranylgeranylglycerophospholipid reductase